jgi:hypothetical protein
LAVPTLGLYPTAGTGPAGNPPVWMNSTRDPFAVPTIDQNGHTADCGEASKIDCL